MEKKHNFIFWPLITLSKYIFYLFYYDFIIIKIKKKFLKIKNKFLKIKNKFSFKYKFNL